MRVAELYEPRRFRIVEKSNPEPAPGEVLVRVHASGICGSDLHYFSEGAVGDTPCVYPMVMGHEPAGTVVKAGTGVTGWAPGDRAALEPAVYCYHCEFCMTGHHNVCANLRFLSTPCDPGFFRDYAVLPAHNLLPLPPGLSLQEATLFEPLAVVLHSLRLAPISFGETAVVIGAGPIGLLTIAALKASGAGRVWALEPVAHRRELASAMGADVVVDPSACDPVQEILRDTGKRGVDVTFDCAARGGSINQSLSMTRNAGRVVVTGIPDELLVPLDFNVMRRKELALVHVRRSNRESELALEMLGDQRRRFSPLLTHELPLEDVERGFSMLEKYEDGVGKVVLSIR
jgi:L-iditol 2-dehydrogenase